MGGTDEKTDEGAEGKPLPLFLLGLVMHISVEYKDSWMASRHFLS